MACDKPFYQIFLHPNFKDGHVVAWVMDPTFSEPGPWHFTLQASETADFSEPYYEIQAENVTHFTDASNIKQNWYYAWYYRVILNANGKRFVSRSIQLGGNKMARFKYLNAAEIIRKEMLLMTRYTGFQCWLLKRRIYTAPATNYLDPVSGVALTDTTVEFGTGLVGGYYDPLSIYAQMLGSANMEKLNMQGNGVDEQQQKKLRMAGFPLISPRDVVVFPQTDTRYMIQSEPEYTHYPGTEVCVVQQHVGLLIPNTDTIYQIAMP